MSARLVAITTINVVVAVLAQELSDQLQLSRLHPPFSLQTITGTRPSYSPSLPYYDYRRATSSRSPWSGLHPLSFRYTQGARLKLVTCSLCDGFGEYDKKCASCDGARIERERGMHAREECLACCEYGAVLVECEACDNSGQFLA
ncbi:hypothetical protein EJ06DRAFT_89691 [Trichodelitschia bisporula]|uniref:Uncharacterized protein n=1 Tax=Trichodelitschia bisporula TaxID=703511 RepID=A0A6G1HS26_9PEZI|nr:hypothetical protein EJ06DRAFT_89691 [Trichodelitschia bisporula]